MTVSKEYVPANLLGKSVSKSSFKPLFEKDENENIIYEEGDDGVVSSLPTEDRVDIDNRNVINNDQDRYEPFVKVRNDKKFALIGESSKLNSCARSRSMTNIYFNKTKQSHYERDAHFNQNENTEDSIEIENKKVEK